MSEQERSGKSYTANIQGGVSGQFVQGDGNVQSQTAGTGSPLTQADLAEVARLLDNLRAQVAATAPPETKAEALEQVDELGQALQGKADPDLPDRLGGVKLWFKHHLPALAGAVVSVVVNPIVGKVVEAAGTGLAAEVQRRFGGGR